MRHIVDQGLGEVALLAELVDSSSAVALGELVPVRPEDHGKMDELGRLPAEGVVHDDVEGGRGYPLLGAHDVRYVHEVVVHDVREVVGREARRT